MSYTALYRKFRPVEFEDVKGQEHIITTLKNQIEANRIGHAYLFCGTRGTGKTTVAKIFAKAVNCEHPVNGSPCGECAMCRSIAAGTSMNVIEIDAASNNGVDNIREIREEVAYRPTEGKYKVYIIDEVHMLSIGAFNALLKTLEEPPEYVIFILATTEVHKIPITILSRCQHYDFKRISIETITDRMRDLMQEEQVEVEEKALRYVAKAADGSMRDALSLLDQCIAFYLGQKLTYDNVLEVLGAVDTDVFSRLLRSVIRRDVPKVLDIVDDLVMQGRELTQLATDFTWYLRNLLLVKTSDNIEDVLDISTENMQQLQEEAGMVESDMLLRYIRIFSELSGQLKYAAQKRVLLEVALIKLCTPAMETSSDSILDRIRVLEEKLEQGAISGVQERVVYVKEDGQALAEPTPRPELPNAVPEDVQQVVKNFRPIADEASGMLRNYLKKARLSLAGDNRLMIVMPDALGADFVGREDRRKELESLIENRIGKKVEVEVRHVEEGRRFEDTFVDIEKKINMEIIVED
ncbi:DNA polymerase III subunit gamma/tau [Mediterraneibacter gnavus]|uniref:DNA polymerase III subunit gamma/tau n=1 Tax=Mediterraneibacter gnavus TaxID=33038 RepID=UPI000E53F8F8|nr:DNA polymerase III subunit gamma/tau [Mediterraneibacter gnavus]RHB97039.1 DNA polymerase III subunit gamma/tau [Mediterraneibacter gnavus]